MTATQLKAKAEYEGHPPIQTEIRRIRGGPEGVIMADYGVVVSDFDGVLYVKQSRSSLATGWAKIATV